MGLLYDYWFSKEIEQARIAKYFRVLSQVTIGLKYIKVRIYFYFPSQLFFLLFQFHGIRRPRKVTIQVIYDLIAELTFGFLLEEGCYHSCGSPYLYKVRMSQKKN